jgi:hypothetical protein
VQSADTSNPAIRLSRADNDSFMQIGYRSGDAAWGFDASYASTGAYLPIVWKTSDAVRMHLDTAGNLGLGYTPVSGNGRIQLPPGTTKADGWCAGTDCFVFRSASATITIDSSIIATGDLSQTGGKYHYLRGDASTDGSVRISSQSSGTALIEKRAGGSWTTLQAWS